jgi:hypothetical protein
MSKETRKLQEHHRREAKALRAKHGLCQCSDDERFYASDAEADADKTPARTCMACLRKKLIVKMLCVNAPSDPVDIELAKIGARGYLK